MRAGLTSTEIREITAALAVYLAPIGPVVLWGESRRGAIVVGYRVERAASEGEALRVEAMPLPPGLSSLLAGATCVGEALRLVGALHLPPRRWLKRSIEMRFDGGRLIDAP